MLTKDFAICIRAHDYSETSQIVTFFTKEHGKLSAIAKGSKRLKSTFDGPIELFSYGNILFTDSDRDKLATLTEFQQEYDKINTSGLNKNYLVMNCCFFAIELLNKLTDDYDAHPELFESFKEFLQNAGQYKNESVLSVLIIFQLALLQEIGLLPILNSCANCKTQFNKDNIQNEIYFSSSVNGLVCRDCEMNFPDKIKLSKAATNCLVNLNSIKEANNKTLNEIEKILIFHFRNILGYQPKTAKYFLSL